ncbi:MAG: hypothetical protein Q4D33_02515, partial [Prevotellaceae bacterium]|nr:hypothetical protein [Prevotellaceae bacterium]
LLEWLSDNGYQKQVVRMGLPDAFVEHGTIAQLRKLVGLDNESIAEKLKVKS